MDDDPPQLIDQKLSDQRLIDQAILCDWMDSQHLESGPIISPRILGGGTQNILMAFQRGERDFVLRRPPPHLRANSNETMRREARVLSALKGSDVPHPELISSCPDEKVLGASFYLMEPIDGFNATTGLPSFHAGDPIVRKQMGLSLVEGIASLGAIDYKAVGLTDFGKPEGFLSRQVPRWQSQLTSYEEIPEWPGSSQIEGIDTVASWLESHCPQQFEAGIIHGDYHLANVMFHYDTPYLAAIVDWELTTIGDPLIDLGWLIATWPDARAGATLTSSVSPWDGFPSINALVEHYAKFSKRDLTNINWYGVLACFKLGIILEGTYARACAGKAPKETGDKLHATTINLFNRALHLIN